VPQKVCEDYDSLPQRKESKEERKTKIDLCDCLVRIRVERDPTLWSSSIDM
jgi:hypothetical protein